MRPATEVVIVVTAIIVFVAAALFIHQTTSVNCVDFWPFKGGACIATTK